MSESGSQRRTLSFSLLHPRHARCSACGIRDL